MAGKSILDAAREAGAQKKSESEHIKAVVASTALKGPSTVISLVLNVISDNCIVNGTHGSDKIAILPEA